MAKLSLINREAKRAKMVAKFAAKRAELVAIYNNAKLPQEERMASRLKFQQLPRDSSPSRQRNRCAAQPLALAVVCVVVVVMAGAHGQGAFLSVYGG